MLVLKWLIAACIVAAAIWAGMAARVWQFNVTEPIHFFSDETRNWMWGSYTFHNIHDNGRSFLDTYDELGVQNRRADVYSDYAPMRMAVFTMWAAANEKDYPDRKFRFPNINRPGTRPFNAFYVNFNATMELIGAIGAFMLTRAVVRRARFLENLPERWWTFTGVSAGLAAALILWFNPAMWLSAHSWPGGDSWIVPPFIWAVYFCVRRNWFTAGVALALGVLFKGQQFFIAPVFILWPLFQGRPIAALRFGCGMIGMFGFASIGWTLTYVDAVYVRHLSWPAIAYVLTLAATMLALPLAYPPLRKRFAEQRFAPLAIRAAMAVAALLILSWPILAATPSTDANHLQISAELAGWVIVGVALIGAILVATLPRRHLPAAAFGLAGAGALLSMALFGTCFAWFDAGYLFGTTHWEYPVMGMTSNLPGLLKERFGWRGDDVINDVITTIKPFGHFIDLTIEVTLRKLLFSIFAVLLVIAAAGISMQDRRRSTRLLIGVCTPWLLFFAIPAQIHERYLLFGAAIAAVTVGDSIGMALLGVFLSIVTWMMTMHVLLNQLEGFFSRRVWDQWLAKMYPDVFAPDNQFSRSLHRFIQGTYPDIGWAVLLATGVFFYLTVTPLWVRRKRTAVLVEAPAELPIIVPAPRPLPGPPDRPVPAGDPIPLE